MENRLPMIIPSEEGITLEMPGGAYGKRMISASASEKLGMGILYVDKGNSAHRWHTHDKPDKSGSYEIQYPEKFVEAYLIAQGRGVVQWKADGRIYEKEVETGDSIYFPEGVVEHQVLNNSDRPMMIVYACVPPVGSKK